jgi:predicted dehydrogenase
VRLALECGLHHFCEANIWTPEFVEIDRIARQKNLVAAPSASLRFSPVVKKLREIVRTRIGRLHSFQLLLSTYMPGWHPSEGPEFYGRNRSTSAGREMVPFELAWLSDVFGMPENLSGFVRRCADFPDLPEDLWSLQMDFRPTGVGHLTVLMGSQSECRQGMCVGDHGTVEFDLMRGYLKRYEPSAICPTEVIETGPLLETIEATYAEEIATFIGAICGTMHWPYSYLESATVTAALAACERSSVTGQVTDVHPEEQPSLVPDGVA